MCSFQNAGVKASDAALAAFELVKTKKRDFVVFKINDNATEVVVDQVSRLPDILFGSVASLCHDRTPASAVAIYCRLSAFRCNSQCVFIQIFPSSEDSADYKEMKSDADEKKREANFEKRVYPKFVAALTSVTNSARFAGWLIRS